MDKGLILRNVSIRKDGAPLVDVHHHIAPGEVLTVMGPSGSGKSTLLSFIIGTLARDFEAQGDVILDGRVITKERPEARRVGILFQDDLLFPHMSVAENLAFGLSARHRGRAVRAAQIDTALREIGLDGFGARDPSTLSGGQKARVGLMRMLLSEPCALLLDEPFSRLDMSLRAQMRALVFGVAKSRALPVVMVTHDAEDADAAGGSVLQVG